MGDVDLTVETDGFDSEDDDCLVQGCGCPDPRICSATRLDAAAFEADGTAEVGADCALGCSCPTPACLGLESTEPRAVA